MIFLELMSFSWNTNRLTRFEKLKTFVGIDGTGLGLIRHHKKLGECVTSNSSLF